MLALGERPRRASLLARTRTAAFANLTACVTRVTVAAALGARATRYNSLVAFTRGVGGSAPPLQLLRVRDRMDESGEKFR